MKPVVVALVAVTAFVTVASAQTGPADRGTGSAVDQPAKHGPGEPGTQAETPGAPVDTPARDEATRGAHAERPGKHSTTTGRHGTSGDVGGGVNTQSGAGVAPSDDPVLERRQDEERGTSPR